MSCFAATRDTLHVESRLTGYGTEFGIPSDLHILVTFGKTYLYPTQLDLPGLNHYEKVTDGNLSCVISS